MNNENISVTRCEKKYIISIPHYIVLSSLLKSTLQRDVYSKEDGNYFIRSLYFDSINNGDYYDKKDGLYQRKKIRLRIYQFSQEVVKLEAKRKYGKYMRKETGFISKEDVHKLIVGNYDCLLKYQNKILNNIYTELVINQMCPKIIVDYEREAYVQTDHNIRINFDKRVRATSNLSIFSDDLIMVPIQTDEYYILEVKYNEYLPIHIQSILSSFNLIETSYSKYMFSRI